MSRISRPGERSDWPEEPAEAFEELGDDAIIAQQSRAHLPQKRASVHEEIRTIVIAEDQRVPPRSAPPPEVLDRSSLRANTVLVRDRRELQAMHELRAQYRARRSRSRLLIPFVWAGLALAAFAAGGLVTLLIARGTAAVFPSAKSRNAAGSATATAPAAPIAKP